MSYGTEESNSKRQMRVDTVKTRSKRKLKAFVLRRDGHTYCFCYPPKHERQAIKAAADCESLFDTFYHPFLDLGSKVDEHVAQKNDVKVLSGEIEGRLDQIQTAIFDLPQEFGS